MDSANRDAAPGTRGGRYLFLRALRSRNYRLFFWGQSVSVIGSWMQQVAAGWLLYRITQSPLLLGIAGFTGQIPSFFLAPIAGVLADRWDRKRMLLVTQAVAALQATVFALLVICGWIRVWEILVLGAVQGIVFAFEVTVRHSFVVDLVDCPEDLGNAIALNSTMVNIARLIGPTAAGLLITLAGEGVCFLLNAITYVPVIAALLAVSVAPKTRSDKPVSPLHALKEGIAYTFHFMPIRTLVILVSLVALLGMPHTVLLPIFAKDVLHGGPKTMGLLTGASGLGALIGSLYLVARKGVLGLGRVTAVATAVFGGGLVLFALSKVLWLSLASMVAVGFGLMVHLAATNTLAQSILEDDKRGRVMSFFAMAFVGVTPLGALWAGSLARSFGAPAVVAFGGIACVLSAFWFSLRRPKIGRMVWPLYQQAGIIPNDREYPGGPGTPTA